ncbi:transcription initiation factor TFIID subunit 4 [Menidia menidia]
MMLVRSDGGQLMLVSQQALAQAQQGPLRAPRGPPQAPAAGRSQDKVTVIRMTAPGPRTAVVVGGAPRPAVVQTRPQADAQKEPPRTFSQETLDSVKKCKNFLVTLIKLASSDSRSANMAANVRGLVRSLLEGRMEAEEFTQQLYAELRSTPQPCLVPFLKKSLPAVRSLTADPQAFIQQASAPPRPPGPDQRQGPGALRPAVTSQSRSFLPRRPAPGYAAVQSGKIITGAFSMRQNLTQDPPRAARAVFRESYREEDDINDVASMAGVNLREEKAQILTSSVGTVVQSCLDQPFLCPQPLVDRVLLAGRALGVTEVGAEVVALVSHATQECLRGLLEKLALVAQHRKAPLKEDQRQSRTSDVRSQLRFLEEVERLKKKRKDEEEREALLRLAKSRSNPDDPQLQQLRQRARELQQMEEAQLMHREANMAALAAIGPRRRREQENQVAPPPRPGPPRPTRVLLRDLLLCMEQERFLYRSLRLYSALQRPL